MQALAGLLLGVSLAALSLVAQADAFARQCELNLPPPRISVEAEPVRYGTDFSRSVQWLREHHPSRAAPEPGSQFRIQGMTKAKLSLRVQYHLNLLSDPRSGRVCTSPEMTVRLGYDPMTIYIARSLEPGSCRFNQTMEHEKRHVAVYRKHLEDVRNEIEAGLRNRFDKPYYMFEDQHAAVQYMNEVANSYTGARLEQQTQEMRAKQASLDTEEAYREISRACE